MANYFEMKNDIHTTFRLTYAILKLIILKTFLGGIVLKNKLIVSSLIMLASVSLVACSNSNSDNKDASSTKTSSKHATAKSSSKESKSSTSSSNRSSTDNTYKTASYTNKQIGAMMYQYARADKSGYKNETVEQYSDIDIFTNKEQTGVGFGTGPSTIYYTINEDSINYLKFATDPINKTISMKDLVTTYYTNTSSKDLTDGIANIMKDYGDV